MTDIVNIGLIGAGGIAHAYTQAFQHCDHARLVAIADINAEAAQTLAAPLGCQSFATYPAMLDAVKLDAVIVCTPPATHADISLSCLERRLHVLCEKPLSIDSDSARAMVQAAHEAGVYLTMASKYRYVEDIVQAQRMVTSGLIGELQSARNTFMAQVDMTSRWHAQTEVSGGGVLMDNGPHAVDLLHYFLGPLAEVKVVEGQRSQGLMVEETIDLLARSYAGISGRIALSWSDHSPRTTYLDLYGSHGAVCVGWQGSKYRQSPRHNWIAFGKGYDKLQALRGQIENFAKAIQGREQLRLSAAEALASVSVIEAAYTALRQHCWTAVNYHPKDLESETSHPPFHLHRGSVA